MEAGQRKSLKKLLKKKPFDKITIADLTEDCGISRMAFYYHFKDIYDLVEWSCLEDAQKVSKLIDNLDDLDDVQNIYSNWTASDEVMAQLDEE